MEYTMEQHDNVGQNELSFTMRDNEYTMEVHQQI